MFLLSYIKVICKIQPIGDQNIQFGPNWGWNAPLGWSFFQRKYIGLKLVSAPILVQKRVWSQSSYFTHGRSCLSQESIFKFFCCNIESMKEMFCSDGVHPANTSFQLLLFSSMFSSFAIEKEKNLVNKNQGWEPVHQKCKANENTSRHNSKKTISKNHVKTLCKEDPWLQNDIQR